MRDALDTSELRYKEYKAHIPPKWMRFESDDTTPQRRARPGRGFTEFLVPSRKGSNHRSHRSGSRTTADEGGHRIIEQDDIGGSSSSGSGSSGSGSSGSGDDDHDEGGVAARSGGGTQGAKWKKNWMRSMSRYVRRQEAKVKAKERTAELQRRLRLRQQVARARREREVAAPALAEISAKSSLVAQAVRDPEAAAQYHLLLCTAAAAAQSRNSETVAARFAERQRQRTESMDKHLHRIDEVSQRHMESLQENSKLLAHEVEARERAAQQRREQLHEDRAQALAREHSRAIAKEESLQRARDRDVLERERRIAVSNAEAARRAEASRCQLEQSRARFEASLEKSFADANERLLLLEARRKVKIDKKLGVKAYRRAMEGRQQQRAAILSECERMTQRREERLRVKAEADRERLEEHVAASARRQHIHLSLRDAQWRDREAHISDVVARHYGHASALDVSSIHARQVDASCVSRTEADVRAHLQRKAERDRAREAERQQQERAKRIAERDAQRRLQMERHRSHTDFASAEDHRRRTRLASEARKKAREAQTLADAEARQAQAAKHLADFIKERDAALREKAQDRSQRTSKSIEYVNVEKHNALVAELQIRDARLATLRAQQEREEAARIEAERLEEETRQRARMAQVSLAQRRREQRNEAALQQQRERTEVAQAQRDRHLEALRGRLRTRDRAHTSMAGAAEAARADAYERRLASVVEADAAWAARQKEKEREVSADRHQRSQQRACAIEEHQERATAQRLEKATRTIDKLEATYALGPLSQRHPTTPAFGSFSAERARSALL